MKRFTRETIPLLVLVAMAAASSACTLKGTVASFPGYDVPVLLGPTDRIGGGEPLATKVRGEFEEEVEFQHLESNYSTTTHNVSISETKWSGPYKLTSAARGKVKNDQSFDIRLTDVMPAGWTLFYIAGMKSKVYVSVEGDIVEVEGKR